MRPFVLVAVGGAIGASARWLVGQILATEGFPWATLSVNVVGCLLVGLAARHLSRSSDRWMFVVTGLLGGLTTYSTFAVETRGLLDQGHPGRALVYVAASVVGGLAATEVARGDWRAR